MAERHLPGTIARRRKTGIWPPDSAIMAGSGKSPVTHAVKAALAPAAGQVPVVRPLRNGPSGLPGSSSPSAMLSLMVGGIGRTG